MRVVTWNVNSIRARHDQLIDWIGLNDPDVVALQETRCDDLAFAPLTSAYRRLGFEVAHHGTGSVGGVAILSRVGLDSVERGFPGVDVAPFDEPRLISAVCSGLRLHNVYAPSGRRFRHAQWWFKLDWLRLLKVAVEGDPATMLAGDFNVQPTPLDVYDPGAWKNRNHGSAPEREAIAALLDAGLRDVTRERRPEPGLYTWWSLSPGRFEANLGMRIDLVLCSDDIADRVTDAWVDRSTREVDRPSDHAPVVVDLDGRR